MLIQDQGIQITPFWIAFLGEVLECYSSIYGQQIVEKIACQISIAIIVCHISNQICNILIKVQYEFK